VNGPDDVYVERKGRIERVADRLFEGEEAVLHVMGEQIASEKRRNPWTLPNMTVIRAGTVGYKSLGA
jgi:hypothetical protein